MLQRLSEHVAECLAHARVAERRATEATDATSKREYADMASRWRRLAESYQFVERVDSFLNNTKTIGSMSRGEPRPRQGGP